MKQTIPINFEVLKWARTSLALEPESVAHSLGGKITSTTVLEWEQGIGSPTYSQLEKLAHDIYKRPVALFFFPDVPQEPTPKTEFRTLPNSITNSLKPEIIKMYRKAKAFQFNLEELYEGKSPVQNSLLSRFQLDTDNKITVTAASIREAIGIYLKEQSTWRNPDIAFKVWRATLEENGIAVFRDAFRTEDYFGFCLYDERYPLIYVNNSATHTRQVFTLFHELAHLLYKVGGIDFRSLDDSDRTDSQFQTIEMHCNRFAAEFLVPLSHFKANALPPTLPNVEELSRQYSVSRDVILRRYRDANMMSSADYSKMSAELNVPTNSEGSGGNYYNNQQAYLGANYVELVIGKHFQGRISTEAASDYLNIKIKNFSTFEQKVLDRKQI